MQVFQGRNASACYNCHRQKVKCTGDAIMLMPLPAQSNHASDAPRARRLECTPKPKGTSFLCRKHTCRTWTAH
ncbi:unnamed protein product [Clonostachys rhizophaga]|uniref:Zn(2)-C6 fungal-type domain-containing protein n=1 Tax=Clonostachys rhizophaga TaxID=160324 RepID=A0A9N9VJ71_9HYPO|nr:unnamed protein product [Clonostachys rhizophaga]